MKIPLWHQPTKWTLILAVLFTAIFFSNLYHISFIYSLYYSLYLILFIHRYFQPIGGFHVTQVTLIITQVKNKIAYLSIYWVKKLKYIRRVINKQRAKVSGMCDIPNSCYSAKGFTENYRV